jgi:hypothetical protein
MANVKTIPLVMGIFKTKPPVDMGFSGSFQYPEK